MSFLGAPPSAVWVLLFVALVCVAAWRIRRVLAPGWSGAPARLAEAVLGISLAIVLAELLGLFGLLSGFGLELGAALIAAAALALTWNLATEGEEDGTGWEARTDPAAPPGRSRARSRG